MKALIVFAALSVIFWSQQVLACFSQSSQRTPFLTEPPQLDSAPHIAQIEVRRVLAYDRAEAAVIKALKGFGGVEFVVVNTRSTSCDIHFEGAMVGKHFYIGGDLEKPAGRPAQFFGLWRRGKPVSAAEIAEETRR